MTFSRPVLGLFVSALVGGCGGGDTSPGVTGDPNAPIYVSAVQISSGVAVAFAGQAVQFSGGICSGGYGGLFAMWSYGDGTPNGGSNVHTYANPGEYPLRVTCTDSSNNDKKYAITAFSVTVAP